MTNAYSIPPEAVATEFHVSASTVRRWCGDGWLPAQLVGPGCWRIRADYRDVIAARTSQTQEERRGRIRGEQLVRSERRNKRVRLLRVVAAGSA